MDLQSHLDVSEVVLVDSTDTPMGTCEKMRAHREGRLHRAFSVFLFNPKGDLLLQRRHAAKYHSGGLWSNTCCSHPLPGEDVLLAAGRRLHEEMGIACPLRKMFHFLYRAEFPNGLIEHEFDHVFVGTTGMTPRPNPTEVEDWRWVHPSRLLLELKSSPEDYTYWFHMSVKRVLAHLEGELAFSSTG